MRNDVRGSNLKSMKPLSVPEVCVSGSATRSPERGATGKVGILRVARDRIMR